MQHPNMILASANYFYSKNQDDEFFLLFFFPSQHELNGGISSPFIRQKDKEEANGPQNNMARFYRDPRNTDLTPGSPSVRQTHRSGRKHKENEKDYQKWLEEQAQSLIHKTTVSLQQGEMPPPPFSASLPAGAMVPPPPRLPGLPRPGTMPAPQKGGPSFSWDDASGTYFWNETAYRRPHANDAWAPSDGSSPSPMMSPLGQERLDQAEEQTREPLDTHFLLLVLLHQIMGL